MSEFTETPTPKSGGTKRNLLIVAGLLFLCCSCVIGAYVFYQYLGDPLLQMLGL